MKLMFKTKLVIIGTIMLHSEAAFSAVHLDCQTIGDGSSSSWLYWPNNPVLTIDTVSLNANQRTEINTAVNRFNVIGNSARNIVGQFSATGAFASFGAANGNNANNIWQAENGTAWGSTLVDAGTNCDSTPGQIQEFDIRIDNTANIVSGVNYDPTVNNYPLKLLAMHEIGHGMGLNHTPGDLAIMNDQTMAGGDFGQNNVVAYHADDKEGFRQIYGDGTSELNVAGSSYWVSPTDGAGLREFDLLLSGGGFPTAAPGNINRGSWYKFPFHIENQSTNQTNSFQDVRVTFYASANQNITTFDTYLGDALYTMNDGAEYQGEITFQLPNSLQGGGASYYFGYLLSKPYNSTPDDNTLDDAILLRIPRNVF